VARLYTNENVPLAVVQELRRLGHDVLTSLDAGNANQSVPDLEVLYFAAANNRVLLTFNRRDFLKLHARNSQHSGIVLCTVDPDFASQANRIDEALRRSDDMTSQIVRVYRS
jgi:predicted nuclease of predicted toxin-antitoxin system